MTLREVYREFVVANRRAIDKHNQDVWLAWHTGMFVRRNADPKKWLVSATHGSSSKQGPQQLRATLAVLAQQYGFPLMRGGKQVVM